jgi:predicted TPR repeat methyltransferase
MDFKDTLQQAITHHKAGELENAEKLYRSILSEQANHPNANHNLGVLFKQGDKADLALPFFKTALEANPNQGQYWISYIDTLIHLGQYNAAQNILNQGQAKGLKGDAVDQLKERLNSTVKPSPESIDTQSKTLNVNATLKQAKSHAKQGQLDEARQLYYRVLEALPQNQQAKKGLKALQKGQVNKENPSGPPQAQIDAVISLYSQGQAQEALSASQMLIKDYPNTPLLYNISGACYNSLGQLEAAVKSYEQALAIKPDYADAKNNLGITLQELGQLEAAVKSYEQVLAIKPDYAEAHNNLGNTLQELDQLEAAVKSYEKALAIKPDYAEAHNNLGNTFQKLGQLETAVKSYEKALAIKPDYADAKNYLGITLQKLSQLEAAVKSYEQALAIKPDYAEAHNNLGATLQELGQLEAAIKCYEQALAIKPYYAEAHNNLGNTLQKLGQLEAAVKSYEKALAIKPDYDEAQHILNSLTGKTSQSAPKKYIENLFNNYADKFEDSLVNNLEYAMPSLLKKIFLNYCLTKNNICRTVDLGCGTGLCGVEFRDQTEILIGIDLSNKMIAKAKEKNIYDELYVNDLINGLKELERKFDLFISADVFIYVGDLKDLFNTVSEYATKHSLFIFSTEDEDGNSFHLRQSGRYAHSKKYIAQLASTSGFKLEHFERSNLRKDKGKWIVGGIYILRRI